MAELKPGNSRQQTNTEILMDCQTEIKLLIKQAMFDVMKMANFEKLKNKLIDEAINKIDDEELKIAARRVLNGFANREYELMVSLLKLGNMPLVIAFNKQSFINANNKNVLQNEINQKIRNLSISDFNKAYSQLGSSQAKVSYGQSLYGRCELNARFQQQQEMVENLKKKTNLVVCDTHSDCSDRCAMWQGRVYSLDGTSGTTKDGRKYIPLEVATNAIFKGHRNGLLGYNCRHKLVAYEDGLKPVKVSSEERNREYEITTKQRMFERSIRKYKDMALAFKEGSTNENQFDKNTRNFMNNRYKHYKNLVNELNAEYKQFCTQNNRVEYRSRLKI